MPAGELRPGDRLSLADGSEAEVTALTTEEAVEGESFTTYNFEVSEFHTYFVGDTGVWVHNAGALCEKAFSIWQRHRTALGESPETAFKAVESALTQYMTKQGFTKSQRLQHMGDVLDAAIKEVRGIDPNAKIWTSQKKLSGVQNMWDHWVRHRADFPDLDNAVAYVQKALDFVNSPTPSMRIGTRPGVNALGEAVTEKVFMDMSNGNFAVQVLDGSEPGALKTFFPKDGGPSDWLEYWDKQRVVDLIK